MTVVIKVVNDGRKNSDLIDELITNSRFDSEFPIQNYQEFATPSVFATVIAETITRTLGNNKFMCMHTYAVYRRNCTLTINLSNRCINSRFHF